MMNALAALMTFRQARGAGDRARAGTALAEVGTAITQLRVRLKPDEEDVARVLILMVSMVQNPVHGVGDMLGETMVSLTDWARGDLATNDLISDVERRAGVEISADRLSARPAQPRSE